MSEVKKPDGVSPGTSLPPDQNNPKSLVSPEDAILSNVLTLVHAQGAGLIHTKGHPDWFKADAVKTVIPVGKEPAFQDYGQIGFSPDTHFMYHLPLGDLASDISKFGQVDPALYAANYLLLSAPVGSSDEYNLKALGGKFSGDWRELRYLTWQPIEGQAGIANRRMGKPLFLSLQIFLPSEVAVSVYQRLQSAPGLPDRLLRRLYPNFDRLDVKTQKSLPLKTLELPNNRITLFQAKEMWEKV